MAQQRWQDWGRSLCKRPSIRIGLALVAVLAIAMQAASVIEPRSVSADARQHLTMAYNLERYGILSDEDTDQPTIAPSYRREPLYPMMLAAVLHSIPDSDSLTLTCLLDAKRPCRAAQVRLQIFNLGLFLALVLATFLATYAITSGQQTAAWIAALAVGFSSPLVDAIQSFYAEVPASLALLVLSTSLYLTCSRPRWWWAAIAAGLALGALILIKAVFVYLGWVVLGAIGALALWQRTTQPLKAGLLVLLIGYSVAGIWMARNYVNFGTAAIAGRGGEVLAIRAEFSTMTWREYGASFLAHTPDVGPAVLQQWFDPEDYQRFDRENPDGFYRRTKNRQAALRRNPHGYTDIDDQQEAEAIALIRQNWVKHLALTASFAYQGAYIPFLPETLMLSDECEEPGACLWIKWLLWPTRLIYSLSFILVLGWAIWQRQTALLLFLLPSLYSIGIHAIATHYIPRYSEPLIPCLAVALALVVLHGQQWTAIAPASKPLDRR